MSDQIEKYRGFYLYEYVAEFSAQILVVFAFRYRGPPQHRRVEKGVGAAESRLFSAGCVSAEEEQEAKTEDTLLAELELEPEKPQEQVLDLVQDVSGVFLVWVVAAE